MDGELSGTWRTEQAALENVSYKKAGAGDFLGAVRAVIMVVMTGHGWLALMTCQNGEMEPTSFTRGAGSIGNRTALGGRTYPEEWWLM